MAPTILSVGINTGLRSGLPYREPMALVMLFVEVWCRTSFKSTEYLNVFGPAVLLVKNTNNGVKPNPFETGRVTIPKY